MPSPEISTRQSDERHETIGRTSRRWSAGPVDVAGRRYLLDMFPYCVGNNADVLAVSLTDEQTTADVHAAPQDWEVIKSRLTRAHRHARYRPRLAGPATVRRITPSPDCPPDRAIQPDLPGHFVGSGSLLGDEAMAALVHGLDEHLRGFGARWNAREWLPPATVSWDTLARAGYLSAFPQHVTALSVVPHDIDALGRLAEATDDKRRQDLLEVADAALTPAACLNIFAGLAGSSMSNMTCHSLQSTCGRYEAGHREDVDRLWTYRVREFVGLGEQAEVAELRDEWVDGLEQIAHDLGLPSTIERATDPFFGAPAGDMSRKAVDGDLKVELRPRLGGEARPAVASINSHRSHFGQSFGIHLEHGPPVQSACVGFGLERWALALLAVHGRDPASWPDPLRPQSSTAAAIGGRDGG